MTDPIPLKQLLDAMQHELVAHKVILSELADTICQSTGLEPQSLASGLRMKNLDHVIQIRVNSFAHDYLERPNEKPANN